MNNEEFSKIIKFFIDAKKDLSIFNYSLLTIEQIERLLKEVNNKAYNNKKNLVIFLMNKKYNKILKKEMKKNDLDNIKKVLWEIIDIFKEYCQEYIPGILLQILKINKEQNIMEIKPDTSCKICIFSDDLVGKHYLNDLKEAEQEAAKNAIDKIAL